MRTFLPPDCIRNGSETLNFDQSCQEQSPYGMLQELHQTRLTFSD